MNFHFFKRPSVLLNREKESFSIKITNLFICLLFLFIILVAWGIFLQLIDFFCLRYYDFSFLNKLQGYKTDIIFKNPDYNGVFLAVIMGPILEELTYRFSLDLKKSTVIVSLIMLCFIGIGDNIFYMDFSNFGTWFKFLAIIGVIFGGYFFITQQILDKIKIDYYAFYFYGFALLFAYDHISIYLKILPNILLVFLPLFVLPQFFLAIFTSYLRLKNGLIWAILLHSLFNLPITIKYLLQVYYF